MLKAIHDYVMPHLLDRSGQEETFQAVMDWYLGPKQYIILSAPTGIGKTGVVANMSKYARILALARTKVLLSAVYRDRYNFNELQGKQNHPCAYSPLTHKADICGIPDDLPPVEKFEICNNSGCPYYKQLEEFKNSFKAVTTYAKYTSDKEAHNSPSLYVFDEAHDIPELVIERSGISLDTSKHKYLTGFGRMYDNDDIGYEGGITVMREIYRTALDNKPEPHKPLHNMSDTELVNFKRDVMRHKLFLSRLVESGKLMNDSHEQGLDIWHYSSTASGQFSARPMTAAYHFKHIFNTGSQKTLLMSATIGPIMADFLGIEPHEFDFYEAPQPYPPAMRKIFDLGQPNMGKQALDKSPELFNLQALRISGVLKMRPNVSSVILVTSIKKAKILSELLEARGHDVFQPSVGIGTDNQLKEWEAYRKPGAVCVTYNFWEGVSLDDDHMLFIAGIKYPDLSSSFERARAERSWDEFYYRGGINLVQGAGRTQRGNINDYLGSKQIFLAVGGYRRAAKLAPSDFSERIIPWEGVL